MGMSWIALIITVYYALHKVTHPGPEYVPVRNIITFLALFSASLGEYYSTTMKIYVYSQS